MALLGLLRQAPLAVRHTICQLLSSILHHTPEDIPRISSFPGWEVIFLRLLTPFYPHVDHNYPLPNRSHNEVTPTSVLTNGGRVFHRLPPSTLPFKPESDIPEQSPPHYSTLVPERSPLKLYPHETSLFLAENSTPQMKTFRDRCSAVVKEKKGGSDFAVTESGELMDVETLRRERKVSLQVSTPWAETVEVGPEEEDAEVARMVDIVTQLFRCILWNSAHGEGTWKVRDCVF